MAKMDVFDAMKFMEPFLLHRKNKITNFPVETNQNENTSWQSTETEVNDSILLNDIYIYIYIPQLILYYHQVLLRLHFLRKTWNFLQITGATNSAIHTGHTDLNKRKNVVL